MNIFELSPGRLYKFHYSYTDEYDQYQTGLLVGMLVSYDVLENTVTVDSYGKIHVIGSFLMAQELK